MNFYKYATLNNNFKELHKLFMFSIAPFATIISTLFNYLTIIYRDFLCFVHDDFKVCQVTSLIEIIVAKREIPHNEQYLHLPQ